MKIRAELDFCDISGGAKHSFKEQCSPIKKTPWMAQVRSLPQQRNPSTYFLLDLIDLAWGGLGSIADLAQNSIIKQCCKG